MTSTPSATERLGAFVRATRQARGLTQDALARQAGLSRVTVIAIEGGVVNSTLTTLDALARALQVDVQELLRPPR